MGVFNINALLGRFAADQNLVVENNTGIDKERTMSGEIPNFKEERGARIGRTMVQGEFLE